MSNEELDARLAILAKHGVTKAEWSGQDLQLVEFAPTINFTAEVEEPAKPESLSAIERASMALMRGGVS